MMKKIFILLLLLFISFTSYSQRPAKFKDGIELKPINAPSTPNKGTIYFDLAQDLYFGWNGTKWLNLSAEHEILIDGYWVDKKGNTDESNIEVGDQIRGNFASDNYIIANVLVLPHETKSNLDLFIDNYLDDFGVSSVINLTSTSTLASWSPPVVINSITTLDWTVSGGVTIATTTIDDPTFNFSTNTGTANILIENIDNLTALNITNLGITSADISQSPILESFFCQQNSLTVFDPTSNTQLLVLALDINSLSSLDLSNNTILTNISIQQNLFTSFDFTPNTLLENIDIRLNPSLTTVNITGLTALTTAAFSDCALTSFDISTNILIDDISCNGNSFSEAITNQLLSDLVANGVNNGILLYRNNETGQGVTDRATLITRGWAITNFGT